MHYLVESSGDKKEQIWLSNFFIKKNQFNHRMKKGVLFLLLISSVSTFSQGIVLRTGYSYSPEDGLLILPPLNLSLEYDFTYPNTGYIGFCTGGNIMISAWGGAGLYYGYKLKSFFIENRFNWFIQNSYPEYGKERTSQFSINPKIGFEKYHMYIKAGPYFGIKENPDHVLDVNYLHIKNVIIDVEAGFYISINEEDHRINIHSSGLL